MGGGSPIASTVQRLGSRLTGLPDTNQLALESLAPFNFRDMGTWYLLTNDWGRHVMLSVSDFKLLLAGGKGLKEPVRASLQEGGFLKDRLDFPALAKSYLKRTSFHRYPGPSLHMIVVTLRCNQGCLYCHSSVVPPSRTDTDMDLETARQVVDFIFRTPNPTVCIEFQGGEPLLNWPVVKFITDYARQKARLHKKKLIMALVSNFTLMNEEKLDYLFERRVSICTSLDGPGELHNKNRPYLGGGLAQQKVTTWLRKIQARCAADKTRTAYLPGALMTTTRFSLGYAREIIDLYLELGLEQIFIRPLSPIGYAKRVWGEIGYSPQEFTEFYSRCLDIILEKNRQGKSIMERMALVCLTKILKGEDPGYMDMRSPAGAVLGCLAYNYNGEIFVSDEGRMVDHQGDPIFKVGHAATSRWNDVIDHPTTRACASASVLENQPMCLQCAYKPYCGVEPVFHYEVQQSIHGRIPSSPWCVSHMGIFDVLFAKLKDPASRAIFEDWLEKDQCRWQENDPVEPGTPEALENAAV